MIVRPRSIVWFEMIYLTMVALKAVMIAFRRTEYFGDLSTVSSFRTAYPAIVVVVGFAVNGLFWYCIARRGSNVARWIFALIVPIAVLGVAIRAARGGLFLNLVGGLFAVSNSAVWCVCVWLMFRPDATPWFKGYRGPDLKKTFS